MNFYDVMFEKLRTARRADRDILDCATRFVKRGGPWHVFLAGRFGNNPEQLVASDQTVDAIRAKYHELNERWFSA